MTLQFPDFHHLVKVFSWPLHYLNSNKVTVVPLKLIVRAFSSQP